MSNANSTVNIDPFHHLHDEDYQVQYDKNLIGCEAIVACAGRQRTSLAGKWYFTLDQFDEGLRQKWYADEPLPPEQWKKPRDYDAGDGMQMLVPGCWNLAKPEWFLYEGGAWYSKTIERNGREGSRCILRIGAANYRTRVFLNGKLLGCHKGGSTPFFVELTENLHAGNNRLQIQVDNERKAEYLPMRHFDWFNYGGLYREVELLHLPKVFFREASCQLLPDATYKNIKVRIRLSDEVDGEATVTMPELKLTQKVAIQKGRGELTFNANPTLWSPQNPKLYEVNFQYGDDILSDKIGFREIRVKEKTVLLNGDPVFLRGICVHEDDLALGKMSTPEDVRKRLTDAKDLGCNFLRLAHYPHHEHVAEIADEMGILLWEEIPVYWAIDFANPETMLDAANQLCELIRRDINRASVIIWCVGNENADSDARYNFMRSLAELAKREDPTRLTSAACLINREKFRIEDRLAEHLDIIGINEYFGWYEPDMSGLTKLLSSSRPDKPVIISETGADAKAGFHGSDMQFYSEECQVRVYKQQIDCLKEADYICGLTPWLLYDFRSERRQTVFNSGFNRKGLIAEDKVTRKKAFDVLAEYYHSLKGISKGNL